MPFVLFGDSIICAFHQAVVAGLFRLILLFVLLLSMYVTR